MSDQDRMAELEATLSRREQCLSDQARATARLVARVAELEEEAAAFKVTEARQQSLLTERSDCIAELQRLVDLANRRLEIRLTDLALARGVAETLTAKHERLIGIIRHCRSYVLYVQEGMASPEGQRSLLRDIDSVLKDVDMVLW